jgi:hypothetical protein
MTKFSEYATHVVAFNNLGDDSSPDVCETPLPKGAEKSIRRLRH